MQESLTNARRHAPGAPVHIRLDYNATQLSLAVDNARARAETSIRTPPGVGIDGMRERATTLGGAFHAGRTHDGFRVRATLPYEPGR